MRWPARPWHPGDRRTLALVITLALTLRLAPVPIVLPLADRAAAGGFASDAVDFFLPLGHGLAARGEFATEPGRPSGHHVPLYPLLLAGLESLGWRSPAGLLLTNAALGALLLVLLFVWLRRLLGPGEAIVAFALAAILPDFAIYSYLVLSENLSMAFVLGSLVCLTRAWTPRGVAWCAVTGSLLGLAALTREFCLTLLIPFAAAVLAHGQAGPGARRVGVMALAAVLTIAPWTARNHWAFGEWILLSDKLGPNLYLSTLKGRYHPSDARRRWALEDPRQQEVHEELKAALETARSPGEASRLHLRAALRNLREDPWGQLAYLPRKALFFWQANIGLRHRERMGLAPMLLFSEALYAVCLCLALVAASMRLPGGPAGWLLWGLIGWVFAFHLLVGEAEPRYHFTLLPALLALSAVGVRAAWKKLVSPRGPGHAAPAF